MVANGDNNRISLFSEFIDGDSNSDKESMSSPADHENSGNDNDNSCLAALMAHDNDLDKDSWGSHLDNNSDNSNIPYGDMVQDDRYLIESTEEPTAAMDTYDINIERIVKIDLERLHFPTANSDEDSVTLILDPYPDAYRLMDHVLRYQFIMHQNDHWKDED